ncbi:MAG: hypothetical protein IJ511_07890 [Bacteroides sp.]|nr:hypothetical protein [Bacteroides sp.]
MAIDFDDEIQVLGLPAPRKQEQDSDPEPEQQFITVQEDSCNILAAECQPSYFQDEEEDCCLAGVMSLDQEPTKAPQKKSRKTFSPHMQVPAPRRRRPIWPWGVAVLLGVLAWLLWGPSLKEEDAALPLPAEETPVKASPEMFFQEVADAGESSVTLMLDSINGVTLRIYALHNLHAELLPGIPDPNDESILFAAQAADIRRDNGKVVGDFVVRGEKQSNGKSKVGYCAIRDGIVSLGTTLNNEVMEACIRDEGDFFRQYALVMGGEMQPNRLKGKALRRSLARQGEELYIVESVNRESLYDFSEALADIGFTEAIYLVGGSSYGFYRSEDGMHEFGEQGRTPYPNTNYILFRKQHD